MNTIVGRAATVPGPDHHSMQKNRQDFVATHFVTSPEGETEVAVVICDGSTASAKSEIGAGLFAYPAAMALADQVQSSNYDFWLTGSNHPAWIRQYMHQQISLIPYGDVYLSLIYQEKEADIPFEVEKDPRVLHVYDWIRQTLMFTYVAAFFGTRGTLVIRKGDGGFAVDDVVNFTHFDYPDYLANWFMPEAVVAKGLDKAFEDRKSVQPSTFGFETAFFPDATRLALFSDGFPIKHLNEVWLKTTPIELWNQRRNPLLAFARYLYREGELKDDLAIAVFSRDKEE